MTPSSDDLCHEAVAARLNTAWLGRPLLVEQEVDSTNSRIAQLARLGGEHGTILIAESQSRGRGRLQRSWQSPGGLNLCFSVLLRPDWQIGESPPLSLAAGVALAEATEEFLPAAPELKWPNDLMYGRRKLGGILVEVAVSRGRVEHVVLGIGLNVNQQQFPPELAERAGSLSLAAGCRLDRAEVLATVLSRLEHWIDRMTPHDSEPIIAGWTKYSPWMGKEIRVKDGPRELVGIALGLGPRGALRLRDVDGHEHDVICGDATIDESQD